MSDWRAFKKRPELADTTAVAINPHPVRTVHRPSARAGRGQRRLRSAPHGRLQAGGAHARPLRRLEDEPMMTPEMTREMLYRILSTEQQKQLEIKRQLDFAYSVPGPRALPRQRLLAAREPGRRLPSHPDRDQDARGARPADAACTSSRASRAGSCSSPGRPARASRRRWRR